MSSCNDPHCGETAVRFDAFGAWCMRHRWKAPIEPNSVPDWVLRTPAIAGKPMLSNGGEIYIEWVAAGGLYRATLIAVVREGVFTAADLDWSEAEITLVRRVTDCKRCGGYGYIFRSGYDPAEPSPAWPMVEHRERCACGTVAGGPEITPMSFDALAKLLEDMPPASEIPRAIEVCPSDWDALARIAGKSDPAEPRIPRTGDLPVCLSHELRPGQLKVTYADGHSEIKETP